MFPDDDKDGGTGQDNDGGGGGNGSGNDKSAAMEKQVGALAATVKLLGEGFAQVKDSIEKLAEKKSGDVDDNAAAGGDNSGNAGDDDAGLETLSRKEFATILLSRASRAFEKKLEEIVGGQLKKVDERLSGTEAREQLRELLPENPDLNDWKDEMVAILKEGRVRSFKDALIIARASDPEKAKKLEAERKKKAGEEGSPKSRGFGGFTPTSSAGGGGAPKKMTVKEAGEAAWQETMAAFGDVLKSSD